MRLGVPVLLLLALASPPAAAEPPNVLLIVVDTLRADHLGAYGYPRPTSPRLDTLAAGGARFAAARATSSWTAPSVASILTGLYPARHGVELPGSQLSVSTPVMAQALHAAGYVTMAYSANPAFVSARQGFDRGFDLFAVLHGGPPRTAADVDLVGEPSAEGGALKVATAKAVTDVALEAVAGAEAGKPVFLFLHYIDPHGGYHPPAAYAERFGVAADSPLLSRKQELKDERFVARELASLLSLYDGEIAFADAEIGRLVEALPQARPWLIAVTSDHGEEFLEHGGTRHARTLFEESVRVPLLVAGAGVAKGVVVEAPVSIADVWPTLAELAGLAAPADIDGRSLALAARGRGGLEPRPVFADLRQAGPREEMLHRHAVVDGSWKLLQNMRDGFGLYDLGADPGEKRDLLPADAARAASLQARLAARAAAAAGSVPAPTVALGEEERERLRALGYEAD